MRILAISLTLILSSHYNIYTIVNSNSCDSILDPLLKIQVYTDADVMPKYPGGNIALNKFIIKNYHLGNQQEFQGSIKMAFVIDVKGNLIGERIIGKSKDRISSAEKEALRVLRLMPRWKPGFCKSQAVPVYISFPINF